MFDFEGLIGLQRNTNWSLTLNSHSSLTELSKRDTDRQPYRYKDRHTYQSEIGREGGKEGRGMD